MIQLLQIINHMFDLDYTETDIIETMREVENGDSSWDDVLEGLGVELSHPGMMQYLEKSGPKWNSALHVVKMQRGVL